MIVSPVVLIQQRPGIDDDALCEICLERMAAYRCRRCSFVLCWHCKGEFHKNVATYHLFDQCGQCKKEPPWIDTIDAADADDADDADAAIQLDIENRIYKPFISPETALKGRQYAINCLLCFGTFLVAEVIGFLFILLSGEFDMMKASVSKGNEHFILVIMMLCGIVGLLIMIAAMLVLGPCAFCIAVAIVGASDSSYAT